MAKKKLKGGYEDEAVRKAVLLIGQSLTDKTNNDDKNQKINDLLKEAIAANLPTSPRFLGAKRLKQALMKTEERISPLKWTLQGDGASEELEIAMTKGLMEVLHRGGYDITFSGKQGVVNRLLRNGDAYRLIFQQDDEKTAFPVGFKMIDQNNIFVNTSATTFRGGNKNVTHLVALFTGTVQEFNETFPDYADRDITPGVIPKNTNTYKDLDQTYTQKTGAGNDEDNELMDWAYSYNIADKEYRMFAGSSLEVLESESGDDFSFTFTNLEGKEEPYIPVADYMCMPSVEGVFNDGLGAYLYDLSIVFRQVLNMSVGHVQENAFPHTLISGLTTDSAKAFFGMVRMADQLRNSGQKAYIPVAYDKNNPNATPQATSILNGGNMNEANMLLDRIDDEFRKCGVYLDDPVDPSITATQVKMTASNALVLPKSIMKFNAPEVEFEVMVAIDMIKKYVKDGDETPLILDTQIELPDGEFSVRGVPFTLGWLKEELTKRQWRVVTDKESGANTSDAMLQIMYQDMLTQLQPGTPQHEAVTNNLMLVSGITVPKPSSSTEAIVADEAGGEAPLGTEGTGGQPIPAEGPVTPLPEAQFPVGI